MRKKYLLILSVIFCLTQTIEAQINRTLNTKVADILAQMPTNDVQQAHKAMQQIIDLDEPGILAFCDLLVPVGTGNDTQVRYALQTLAAYSGGLEPEIKNNLVETAFIQAIEQSDNNEVKTFLIERLQHCASNKSVSFLSSLLKSDALYQPALATLYAIGSLEASQAILTAMINADQDKKVAFINTLGRLKYLPSAQYIEQLATIDNDTIVKYALEALGNIGAPSSYPVLLSAVKKAKFSLDYRKAIMAFIDYGQNSQISGNIGNSNLVAQQLLKHCKSQNQWHYRLAGLLLLSENKGDSFNKTLIKETKNSNIKYTGAIIDIAKTSLNQKSSAQWVKAYRSANEQVKPQIIYLLESDSSQDVLNACIKPALNSKNASLKIAGIKALAHQNKEIAIPLLTTKLNQPTTSQERIEIESSLLKLCSTEDAKNLSTQNLPSSNKTVIVNIWAARNATSQFDAALALLQEGDKELNNAVYNALPSLASENKIPKLLTLLENTTNQNAIANVQKAIITVVDRSEDKPSSIILNAFNRTNSKEKYLPILPALQNDESLKVITNSLHDSDPSLQKSAISALANWRNDDALPFLFQAISSSKNKDSRALALKTYFQKVVKSAQTDDQKLLLLRKTENLLQNSNEKKQLIYACGNIKTFLSLVFVGSFLEDDEVDLAAAQSAVRIALPTPNSKQKFEGNVVREIVTKSAEKLTGPDSQYVKIDIKEFLDNMSDEPGFISIFNGKDLTGWEGLVENPIARGKMSAKQLAQAQEKANNQMLKDWFVKDGVIGFKGEGYNNICTIKDYGDFEMLVDWKITNGGDSGIYLRGTPQVQIWDIARTDVGAQVGSGGLYNNQKHESKPLKVADNPINEWNTFRIKMVGERVTVHLNGVLVTDNVILENYWDRKQAIFAKEAIELQAHGEDLGFRNVYVKEIPSGNDSLSEEEKKQGFESLFNGVDLSHWIGNKTDYLVENQNIVVRPKNGGHGNLYTAEEYSDFIFRFEFKLTPGANNGLGVHAPLEGDAAYAAKEIQILDNTADIYANLKDWQYHGSVYGIIAAKKGHLNPIGEWNYQEVMVKGDHIKVTLNGTVILDGNLKNATQNGTLDGKEHPGLKRHNGHIAFLGHGSELKFKNIRIKRL